MKTAWSLLFAILLTAPTVTRGASWLDFLGLGRKSSTNSTAGTLPASLSEEQIVSGLKEALSKGVNQSVAILGKENGFLKDAAVRIPMPDSLQRIERTLRSLGQDRLADDFVASMNRAAEKAVPEAAGVLGDSIKQMSLTDARSILTGTNTAATAYFRRTSESNLFTRFQPIVQRATSQAGVTGAYKRMTDKVGFAAGFLGKDAGDLDAYITRKSLDGLFVKIAEEEKRIRENPAARSTELLQKVFGSLKK